MARQQRRALSTIVGALLFLVILVSAFGSLLTAMSFMTTFQEKSIEVANSNLSQVNELFTVSTKIDSSCRLYVGVENEGSSSLEIVELFLINNTNSDIDRYDVINMVITPGNSRNVTDSSSLSLNGVTPQTISIQAGKAYKVKVVTSSGTSQIKSFTMPSSCNFTNLVGELIAAPPEIASNENLTIAFVVVNRGDTELFNVTLGNAPSYNLTISPSGALVDQDLITPAVVSNLVPGASAVFKWSLILKGGLGTYITITTKATASEGTTTGDKIETVKITKQYTREVVSQRLVARPEVFMIVPSPFGESGNDYGLWGVTIVNPTDTSFTVHRIVVALTTSITDRAERFIENDASCVGTQISPTSGWSCPEENLIQWYSVTGVTIGARDVRSFLATYQTGSLGGGGDDPGFIVSGSVFTSFGQFSKGNYISGTEQGGAGIIGNVYLTNSNTDNGAQALQTARILGNVSMASGASKMLNVTLADFSSDNDNMLAGTKLVINVPAGFTVSGVPASTTRFSSVTSQTFDDDSTQIVATLGPSNLGDGTPSAEAAVLSFTVTAPDITDNLVYVMYALAQGETSGDLTAGPVAEIPIRVVA